MRALCCMAVLRAAAWPMAPGSQPCPNASQVSPALTFGFSSADRKPPAPTHLPQSQAWFSTYTMAFPWLSCFQLCDLLSALCPKPQVANGKLTSTDQMWYPINATVTFECHEGYHHFSGDGEAALKDSWTATCLADGNWTPLPKCVSTVVWLILDECCLISAMESNPDPPKKPFLHCHGMGSAAVSANAQQTGKECSLQAAVWVPICSNSITRGFLCFWRCFA